MSSNSLESIDQISYEFSSAAHSDIGCVRSTNEDAVFMNDAEKFWVVADGMGGHASGQVAANLAVDSVADYMSRWRYDNTAPQPFDPLPGASVTESIVSNAVRVANVRVYNRSQSDPNCDGMGTTIVLMHYDPKDGLAVAHVGDSRCYRLRGSVFERLTDDHSLAGELTRSKLLTEQEAKLHAGSNVILRALGMDDDVQVDVAVVEPQVGDQYLMCSDGLTDLLHDFEIGQILKNRGNDLELIVKQLVDEANARGGNDNITAAIVKVAIEI